MRDQVKNVLDYLTAAELVLNVNEVSVGSTRVAWHSHGRGGAFLVKRDFATLEQYLHWVTNGMYSAMLLDASLLQISYDIADGDIAGHRLAYIPCPFEVDQDLLSGAESVPEIVDLYGSPSDVALRSPIRFDYDPNAAATRHPAAHLTINVDTCRIGCVAPMHVHRFIDFVFRHFYPHLWYAHRSFFASAAWQHLGGTIIDCNRATPHITWNVHATQRSVMSSWQND